MHADMPGRGATLDGSPHVVQAAMPAEAVISPAGHIRHVWFGSW